MTPTQPDTDARIALAESMQRTREAKPQPRDPATGRFLSEFKPHPVDLMGADGSAVDVNPAPLVRPKRLYDAKGRFLPALIEQAAADDADEIGATHPTVWVLIGAVATLVAFELAILVLGMLAHGGGHG